MASILAVDDSPSVRQMVAFTLKSAGHDVITAADGGAALAVAKRKTVNLVVAGIDLADSEGIALVRELRSLPTYRFTPLLVLTTESSRQWKLPDRTGGATEWIVKPFDSERLLATVDRVLDKPDRA